MSLIRKRYGELLWTWAGGMAPYEASALVAEIANQLQITIRGFRMSAIVSLNAPASGRDFRVHER